MRKNLLIGAAILAVVGTGLAVQFRWMKAHRTTAATSDVLKDVHDREVTLSQFRGKVVLVNFWATWCGPCRIEIPWLIEFQQKYGPRGFTVLGIAMDDEGRQAVEPFVEKERFEVNGQPTAINYPIVIGNDAVADRFGGLVGIPTSVLLSRDGAKVKTIVGLTDPEKISKEIEALL